MCYLFSCFGWLLDLVQRIITFFLACWISCAVCIGLTIAATAGIAYGYNYQMAEWLTFTRSDVGVYMRRGQFYDRPDVEPRYISRRVGDQEEAPQAAHEGGEDYVAGDENPQDMNSNALPASWTGVKGAANLVDKIHQFTDEPKSIVRGIVQDSAVQADLSNEPSQLHEYYKLTSPSRLLSKLISITPNSIVSTAVWKSGDSNIIMRNFQISTMKNIDPEMYKAYHPSDYMDRDEMEELKFHRNQAQSRIANMARKQQPQQQQSETMMRATLPPHMRIREEWPDGSSSGTIVMRHWGPTTTPIFQDYTDDVNEDSIVYKPG